MALTLEVVSPRGVVAHEEGLDRVVVRRREAEYDPGSEIAILPHHGPLLMQTQPCSLRLTRAGNTHELKVGAAVLEVVSDHITLVET
jgi:F0F1-type ATP synthase epsilon subunit